MIPLGTFMGVALKMHFAFPALMAFSVWLGYGRLLIASLLALTLHEAAHSLAARAMGHRLESIELMPFGGVAQMTTVYALRPTQELAIALAGPAASLITSMLSAVSGLTGPLIQAFLRVNLLLGLMNLLPALPLDGGRALRALIGIRFGNVRATNVLSKAGVIVGALVVVSGFWAALNGVLNPLLFLSGAYLIYAAFKEQETLAAACLGALHGRAERLKHEGMLPVRWTAVEKNARTERLATRLTAGVYHLFVMVDENMNHVETLDEGEVLRRTFVTRIEASKEPRTPNA